MVKSIGSNFQLFTRLFSVPFHRPDTSEEVTKLQYRTLLLELLKHIPIQPQAQQRPCSDLTDAIYSRLGPVTSDQSLARAGSKIGTLVAIYFYPLHRDHCQFLIELYAAAYLVLDDLGPAMVSEISQFRMRLLQQAENQPGVFGLLVMLFEDFDREYSTPCANKLFTSVVNTLSILEVECDSSAAFKGPASPLFPKYFRNMTGSSEAFVYFLRPKDIFSMARMKLLLQGVPELLDITDGINDLLSFYKESVVGDERDTYVYQKSRVDGVSVRQTLQSLSREIIRRYALIQRIFKDDPVLQELGSRYVEGQIEFYFACERYRLSELGWST
ncbi:isoprenoid synthase domain-containing protein [Aspergillus lucknowensis]|uniref:Isoprenoid synthase domain-containing protein n=1 Tax=Aspergillus lucknowensis TaxID=176173 RepID=A0ABR4LVG4_9EURO